jgi:SAM-dependent methyltransferase
MNRTEWNRLAGKFSSRICDITRAETDGQIGRLMGAVRLKPESAVLVDLGCGQGTFVATYAERFQKIFAVDYAPRIVARAKRRYKGATEVKWFSIGIERSAQRIGPLADLTVCMNVITSTNAAIRSALWASIAAVTKPLGFALIVVPSLESAEMVRNLGYRKQGGKEFTARDDGTVVRDTSLQKHFGRSELDALLALHGFVAKRIVRAYYPWSEDGLSKPRGSGGKNPWDWACLAQRAA